MTEYMDYTEWLEIEVKHLKDENKKIKHFFPHDELDFLNEITELKKRICYLVRENTRLQNELFSEHLKQVETEDFIDKLKKELKEYRGF